MNKNNLRELPLSIIPDCCGVCRYGDADAEGCEVLIENGFGITERSLNEDFNYFQVCDAFERVSEEEYGRYWNMVRNRVS